MATKGCTKCGQTKPIEDFYLNCYGRNGSCKACVKTKNKAYYEAKKTDIAAMHAERKISGSAPDGGALERRRQTPFAERYASRREKVNANKRDRHATDPQFRAVEVAETRVRRALGQGGSALDEYVGCPRDWFDEWIEFQFTGQMSWANYGVVWSYDHVIPKSAYNFSLPEQVLQCNHWANWRPLLGAENSRKGATRDPALEERHATDAYVFQLIQDYWLSRGNNA